MTPSGSARCSRCSARYLDLSGVGEFVPEAYADAVVFGADWSVDKVMYRGEWL